MPEIENLAALAEDSAERLGERKSLLFGGEFITNHTVLERARRLNTAFSELGLKKDKIAAMCMINDPVVNSVFGGIFRTGGTAVPVMFQLTVPELRYIISHTEAHCVITDSTLIEKIREAVEGLDHIQWIAVRGGEDRPEATPREYNLDTLMESDEALTLPNIVASDVAMLLYTSGTTGRPKGVMLTHANLIASARGAQDAAELHLRPHPMITLTAMPMAHIFGVGVMNGGYIMPKEFDPGYTIQEVWFDAGNFLRIIEEHKVTDLPAVPTMLALMLAHEDIETRDITSIVKASVGAAPVPNEVAEEFARRSQCRVTQIYGMTENTGLGSAARISHDFRPGSAGLPYCNVELKIFDDDDKELPTGEAGEIVTRGETTMKGYLKDPEATAEAMRGGWLHTGDIGYLDEDGYLFVVDRKKDMIIKGGENIFPAEIENVLYKHPDVDEAAVIGVPHDLYGEDVIAFVVTKASSDLSEEDLIAHAKTEVPNFKAPSRIHFVEEIPKSGVGKILRRELRDRVAAEQH